MVQIVLGKRNIRSWLVVIAILQASLVCAQQAPKQDIPDAPSASKPVQQFPANASPPASASSNQTEPSDQGQASDRAEQPPAPNIKTVPQGGATPAPPASTNTRDQLFTIIRNVN